jgi:hypothetical protein
VIATVFVVSFVGIVAGVQHVRSELKVAAVQATGSPSPPRPQSPSTLRGGPLVGAAPWALEALTNCFHQISMRRGSVAQMQAQILEGARLLKPDEVLEAGPCRVRFDGKSARVTRAGPPSERVDLFIPPPIRLYVRAGSREAAPWRKHLVFLLTLYSGGHARLERLGTPPGTRVVPDRR